MATSPNGLWAVRFRWSTTRKLDHQQLQTNPIIKNWSTETQHGLRSFTKMTNLFVRINLSSRCGWTYTYLLYSIILTTHKSKRIKMIPHWGNGLSQVPSGRQVRTPSSPQYINDRSDRPLYESPLQVYFTRSPSLNDLILIQETEPSANAVWAVIPGNGQTAAWQTVMQHNAKKKRTVSPIFGNLGNLRRRTN
jgi:hypothetical protein